MADLTRERGATPVGALSVGTGRLVAGSADELRTARKRSNIEPLTL